MVFKYVLTTILEEFTRVRLVIVDWTSQIDIVLVAMINKSSWTKISKFTLRDDLSECCTRASVVSVAPIGMPVRTLLPLFSS